MGQNTVLTNDEQIKQIVYYYTEEKLTLRKIAKIFNTNHHTIRRRLVEEGVTIRKPHDYKKVVSEEGRKRMSLAKKGKPIPKLKGQKRSTDHVLKNMVSHIRFDVDYDWIKKYRDVEKLKRLNYAISDRSGRWADIDTEWYKKYIEKFYNDPKFNQIYKNWIGGNMEDRYKMPTIDHIVPVSKGGTNDLDNLQFLTWFENRTKNNMSQEEWNYVKSNLKDYFI